MVSTCTTVILTVLQFAVACAGVALVVLGVLNLDNCPVEESLPVWMIAAGGTLLLLTAVCVAYALCTCCGPCCGRGASGVDNNNKSPSKSSEGVGATLCALGCAFVCGAVGVIFLLVWLALWVAGTYFVSMAVGRMRDESLSPMEPTHQETCDLASVSVSVASVALVWALFVGFAVWAIFALVKVARGGGEQHHHRWRQQEQQGNNFYDQVATEQC